MSEIKQDTAFERFCSFDAMYEASYKVCRNVRWKDSTINFEENMNMKERAWDQEVKRHNYSHCQH